MIVTAPYPAAGMRSSRGDLFGDPGYQGLFALLSIHHLDWANKGAKTAAVAGVLFTKGVGAQFGRSEHCAKEDSGAVFRGEQVAAPSKPSKASCYRTVLMREIGYKLGHVGVFLRPRFRTVHAVRVHTQGFVPYSFQDVHENIVDPVQCFQDRFLAISKGSPVLFTEVGSERFPVVGNGKGDDRAGCSIGQCHPGPDRSRCGRCPSVPRLRSSSGRP